MGGVSKKAVRITLFAVMAGLVIAWIAVLEEWPGFFGGSCSDRWQEDIRRSEAIERWNETYAWLVVGLAASFAIGNFLVNRSFGWQHAKPATIVSVLTAIAAAVALAAAGSSGSATVGFLGFSGSVIALSATSAVLLMKRGTTPNPIGQVLVCLLACVPALMAITTTSSDSVIAC